MGKQCKALRKADGQHKSTQYMLLKNPGVTVSRVGEEIAGGGGLQGGGGGECKTFTTTTPTPTVYHPHTTTSNTTARHTPPAHHKYPAFGTTTAWWWCCNARPFWTRFPLKSTPAHPFQTPLKLGNPNYPSSRQLQATFPSHETSYKIKLATCQIKNKRACSFIF